MTDSAFESWYNGMVGFHINSERILDDLDMFGANAVDPNKLRKWMAVCWNNAIDAASMEVSYACGWDDGDVQDRIDLGLEKLKEPLDKTL